jgi:MFS family permease
MAGPTYAAELSPAGLRAALVTFIMVFQALGGVIMSALFTGVAASTNPNIWYVPLGIMFFPAIICCIGTPFAVGESDRHILESNTDRNRITPTAGVLGQTR